MSVRVHRVVVRGQFAHLTDAQRAALLAEVAEHDWFKATFTEWGTFTYDERLLNFNFRYEVRISTDDAGGTADGPRDPVELGLARATASLAEWGLEHKHLRGASSDMSAMWG